MTSLTEQLVSIVEQALREAETPGAAVALLVDGRPLLQRGVGFQDTAHVVPLPRDARFYLYSITKTLIAIAVLQLVQQGRLTLGEPAQRRLPHLRLEQPVTLRQLLRHTAGLPDYGGKAVYEQAVAQDPDKPWTAAMFLERTLQDGLRYTPGTRWAYSNIGYLLLKQILERTSGRSLREVLHERLFAPLRLQHTFVAETLADVKELTPGYSAFFSEDDSLENVTSRYHPGWVSYGVVVSTAPEAARLFQGLFERRLLPANLLRAMLEPVRVPLPHPLFVQPAYGLGLMLDPQSPYGTVAGHGGGGPGYDTAALHFSDVDGHEVIAAVLANRDRAGLALRLAFRLAGHLPSSL